jgi:putative aldouronate transport system substrate-binding protein
MLTSYTGVEGTHWEVKDGKYLTMPQFDKDNKWIQWYFLFENEQPLYKVETYLAPSRRGALEWNVIRDAADGMSAPAQLKYSSDLTALVADYFIRFITGKTPLSEFDKFVSEFNTRGGQEWTDDVNKIYQSKKK